MPGPTHPDGDQGGSVERSEQHGVSKHQEEADAECDLQEADSKRGGVIHDKSHFSHTAVGCAVQCHRLLSGYMDAESSLLVRTVASCA